MAFLIPENVRYDKAVPPHHRRVASVLAQGLDDAVTVWYEPPFDPKGDRPHFVVLDPSYGVVVIEVLDHRGDAAERVLGAWQRVIRIERAGAEVEIEEPLGSASRFATELAERMRDVPALANVSVGAVAALPHLTKPEAEALDLGSVIDLDAALSKEMVSEVVSGGGDEMVLARLFGRVLGGLHDGDMDDDLVDRLRSVIHPDLLIGDGAAGAFVKPPAALASAPAPPVSARVPVPAPAAVGSEALFDANRIAGEDVVRVMDRRQERMARDLGSGHRIIRGVAGSGKTLVLMHRARWMAEMLPEARILVTCYTKTLAGYLAEQLRDLPNIEVQNLDQLMVRVARDAGTIESGARIDWERLPALALEGLERRHPGRYRAVMVDEAQDFATDALRFCVELVESRDGVEGDLLIVADSAQNIFRRAFRWKDAGISASGRTRILRVNYRNTKQILDFAYRFLTAVPDDASGEAVEDADDLVMFEDETAIVPPESAEREGPAPAVVEVDDLQGEIDAVVERVRTWLRPGMPARSIAVLLTRANERGGARRIVEELRGQGVPVFWTHETDRSKDELGAAGEPVVVSTVHSAKGLEFPRVVVADLGSRESSDHRKLLYVAFTRAVDELAVVAARSSPLTRDLPRL